MAKKPDDIQREIAELRESIDRKLDRVQGRVKDDVQDFSSNAWDEFQARTRINEYVDRRPMTTVASAFGVGVLLGILSEGVPMGGNSDRESYDESRMYSRRNGRRQSQGGIVNNVVGTASGVLSGKLGDELQQLMRQVLGEEEPRVDRRPETRGEDDPTGAAPAKSGNGYAHSDREREYQRGH
jgi:ElaB/YqjD/DUF883 family membrane-anchored ribosome-binding protein